MLPVLAVNNSRIMSDIEALAQFSVGAGPGVTRLTFSPEDRLARQYLRNSMMKAGMRISEFCPGVMRGRLSTAESEGPSVMAGSHIDTVLNGGKFDGVLGVVAALEVARVLSENSVPLRSPFEVVIFPEEDGARFGAVLTGSKAWTGMLTAEHLRTMNDADGVSYLKAMEQEGLPASELLSHVLTRDSAKAFFEVHIEQSVVLEKRQIDIGIVTKIIGIRGFDVTLQGVANHAGATPMSLRRDALAGAAEIIVELERAVKGFGPHAVCTVGQINCSPGARNIIPGEVLFSIDFRDVDKIDERWQQASSCIFGIAGRREIAVNVIQRVTTEPVPLSSNLQVLVEEKTTRRGLSSLRMPSGAVHDAQVLAPLVETAMIFVPSRGGRSHCPEEFTESAHIENGANVLLDAVLTLVS
jgi:allantoate deiminase